MRESVPSPRYSPLCNVLRQWKTSLIPTYRVYRLYDIAILYAYIAAVTIYSCCVCLFPALPSSSNTIYIAAVTIYTCCVCLFPALPSSSNTIYIAAVTIIESVDSISKDERGFPLTQYITNGRISRGGYTFTHFKHHHRVLRLISYSMSV